MSTHNKLLFLVISIFSLIISGCATTPELKTKPEVETKPKVWSSGEVNKEQPISIGEEIYTTAKGNSQLNMYASNSYRYMGVDDKNNVKVLCKSKFKPYGASTEVETIYLLLPLNLKKQTILKVISYEAADRYIPVLTKELLITVVDEFNRITVEEIEKTPTK